MEEQISQKTHFKNNSKIKTPITLIVVSVIGLVIMNILARAYEQAAWGLLFFMVIAGLIYYLGVILLIKQLKYKFIIKIFIFIAAVVFTQTLSLVIELIFYS